MKAAKHAGLKVFRTWGFYDKNATFDPTGLPKYGGEGAGPSEIYFQSWDKGVPTISKFIARPLCWLHMMLTMAKIMDQLGSRPSIR